VKPSRTVLALSSSPPTFSRRAVMVALAALLALLGCASDDERIAQFLERGDAYVAEGQDEEAIIEFKNVLQLAPDHPRAHYALSMALLRAQKPREAYWEMSESVRVDPKNIEARLRYGTVSAAIGDFDLSLEQANAVLALEPGNARAFTLRAQALEQREDYEGALSDLQAAIEAQPDAAAFHFLLGAFYERRGQRDDAEAAYLKLLEVEESYMAATALARLVLRDRSRFGEGEALLGRSIALAEQAPMEPLEVLPTEDSGGTTTLLYNVLREEALISAYTALSTLRFDQGDLDGSLAILEEGLEKAEKKTPYIYQMARIYRAAGRPEDEQKMMRRATDTAPDSAEAQLVLSAYLGQQGDSAGALAAAIAAVEADPENQAALLREAELRIDIGFRDQLEESVERGRMLVDQVLATSPESPEANFVKAKLQLAEGDVQAAKQSLELTLTSRPTWAQARFVMGTALLRQGDLARARVEFESAVENMPTLHDARRMLVQVYAELGEHEFAIEEGRNFLRVRPSDSQIRILVGQSLIRVGRAEEAYAEIAKIPEDERDAPALYALARLDMAYGRIKEADQKLQQASALSPGDPSVLRALVMIDVSQERMEDAEARVARAIEVRPEDSELLELQADILLHQDKREEARSALMRAVELDPRNVSAQMQLADLEMKAGNTAAMLEIMEKAALAVPESAEIHFKMANAYERNGMTDFAIRSYNRTIQLNPDMAMAKNNLAYLLAEGGGDLDRALELAQSAKEELPDDGNAADTLGWVLLKRGLTSAAIGYLEEAAERFPEDAFEVQGIVHNHLAIAYEANNELDKALSSSRDAIRLYERLVQSEQARSVPGEPDWLIESRERTQRLESQSS